jgi:DNA repair ATPase RecN
MNKRKGQTQEPIGDATEELILAAKRIADAEELAEARTASASQARNKAREARVAMREARAELQQSLHSIPTDPIALPGYFVMLRELHTKYKEQHATFQRLRSEWKAIRTEVTEANQDLEKIIDDHLSFLPLFDREPAEVRA